MPPKPPISPGEGSPEDLDHKPLRIEEHQRSTQEPSLDSKMRYLSQIPNPNVIPSLQASLQAHEANKIPNREANHNGIPNLQAYEAHARASRNQRRSPSKRKTPQNVPFSSDNTLAVVFDPATSQQLHDLSKQAGVSEGEVLKRALTLMEVAVDASQRDETLAFVDKGDNVSAKITGLIGEVE